MIELQNQLAWLLGVFYFLLIESGVNEDDVSDQFGLKLSQLQNMTAPITIDQFRRLGQIAQAVTNRPDIGLKLVNDTEFDENKGGLILNAAINSPTIRHFLQELVKASALFRDILSFNVREKRDTCEMQMDYFKAGDLGLPMAEFLLRGAVFTLEHVIGNGFKPIRIGIQYPAPHYVDAYHQAFQTRLVFDQDVTSVVFDKNYLDMPTPKPVSIVKEILSRVVDSELEKLNEDSLLQTKIRKLIVKRLPSGEVGVESIADELKLTRGFIYRKLKEENTSYKQLLTLTRKQLATQYLKNPSLSIDIIASRLGYTESSAFKRAFKIWFGINPGQYRKHGPIIAPNVV